MTTLPRTPPHRARLLAWFLLIFPVIVVLFYPIVQDYRRGASLFLRIGNPDATGWLANYELHPVEPPTTTSFVCHGRTVRAQLYKPLGVAFAPGIVLLATLQHSDDGAPQNLARALAQTGYFVMLPQIAPADLSAESAELIACAARAFADNLGARKVGVLAPNELAGAANFAANTPDGVRFIAWVRSGDAVTMSLTGPPSPLAKLTFRERLALVHWMSLLIRDARNTPTSKPVDAPAGAWVPAPSAWLRSHPW